MSVLELPKFWLRGPVNAVRRGRLRGRRLRFYRELVRPSELVFDIGANHGNRVEVFLDLGARVAAVEPQPGCIASLERLRNRSPEVLSIFQGVVGPAVGETEMHVSSVDELSSLSEEWIAAVQRSGRFRDADWSTTLRVPMTTLDALVSAFGQPTFLKIDVEGYELEVLRGLSKRPAALRTLSFEFTPERRVAAEACLDYCASLGAIECNFSEGESMEWTAPKWLDRLELGRLLDRFLGDSTSFGDIYVRFRA